MKDEIVLAKPSWQLLGMKSWIRDLLSFLYCFYILSLKSSPLHKAGGAEARACLFAVLMSTCTVSCDIYELVAA